MIKPKCEILANKKLTVLSKLCCLFFELITILKNYVSMHYFLLSNKSENQTYIMSMVISSNPISQCISQEKNDIEMLLARLIFLYYSER
jgi:hypothetical protein